MIMKGLIQYVIINISYLHIHEYKAGIYYFHTDFDTFLQDTLHMELIHYRRSNQVHKVLCESNKICVIIKFLSQ